MLLTMLIASALSNAPAFPREPDAAALVPKPASSSSAMPTAAAPQGRICVFAPSPGSLIRTMTCRTSAQWIETEGTVPTGRVRPR